MVHRFWIRIACIAFLSSVHAMDASGTVKDRTGTPWAGVVVTLKGTGAQTTTDASGTWRLSSASTGVRRILLPGNPGSRLRLERGRVRLDLDGSDARGRRIAGGVDPLLSPASRGLSSVDTLEFTWHGELFLRDTISGSRGGILSKFDTSRGWNLQIPYGTLEDERDGVLYRTTTIGSQTWMAEELDYRPKSGSDPVCCFTTGRVYTWPVAMGLDSTFGTTSWNGDSSAGPWRGICPVGWHVPSLADLSALVEAAGGHDSGGRALKAPSGWRGGGGGIDRFGFHAQATESISTGTDFWSSTESGANAVSVMGLGFLGPQAPISQSSKTNRFVLRCLRD